MAEPGDIAKVREYVGEPNVSEGWTDERIASFIDGAKNLKLAASEIWIVKAGTFSAVVDVTESGSSRKMGSLQDKALKMAGYYLAAGKAEQNEGVALSAPFSVPIVRRGR